MYSVVKRLLVGRPLRSADQEHQRLIKVIALAIFSSDAISSTAYATEEILHVLVPLAGMAALDDLIPISMVVVTLLAIVVFSYRQTIFAYPNGGGSYIVSRENLDQTPLDHFTRGGAVMTGITLFALMRAFSSGAVALTGIEAISNAVPAFKRPESRNAATTLAWMAVILGVFFFGISLLAHRLGPTLSENETVLSVLGTAVFGRGALYIVLQASTAAILTLAANTAFSRFPLPASLIAQHGYLPRPPATRGDPLAF